MWIATIACVAAARSSDVPTVSSDGADLVLAAAPGGRIILSTINEKGDQVKEEAALASDVTAQIDGKVAEVSGGMAGVTSSIDQMGALLQAASTKIGSLEEQSESDQATISALKRQNALLETGMSDLANQLRELSKQVGVVLETPPPTCTAPDFENIKDGATDMYGDHGTDAVPVSVTITFACDDGFHLVGSGTKDEQTKSTCQHDSDSSTGGSWSGAGGSTHPGCKPCPPNCLACNNADTCYRCDGQYTLDADGNKCILIQGLTKATAADSCLAIYTADKKAKSLADGYWIKVPKGSSSSSSSSVRKMYCIMSDVKTGYYETADDGTEKNRGGFTLVGRAIGQKLGCYRSEGGCHVDDGFLDSRSSFMYEDGVINGLPHDRIIFRGTGSIKSSFIFKAGDDECVYRHRSHVNPEKQSECSCPHQKWDFSDSCGSGISSEGRADMWGVYHWTGNNGVGCLHSNLRDDNPGAYFMRYSADKCGRLNQWDGHCNGQSAGCNVELLVW